MRCPNAFFIRQKKNKKKTKKKRNDARGTTKYDGKAHTKANIKHAFADLINGVSATPIINMHTPLLQDMVCSNLK